MTELRHVEAVQKQYRDSERARVKTSCHIEIDEGKEETQKLKWKLVAGVAFLMAQLSALRHILSTDEKDGTDMDDRGR